ncbi:hypothetical protein ABZ341_18985 [Streptomyces sp. NPDC006173]|uniref:hypothetical protein n=1 Tax=unclassified Streptomyces TaxID=2593676 RepID=UPI0033C370A9
MFRGTTARTLFVVLAAVLLGLQPLAPAESSASAHRGEVVACAEAEHPHKVAPAQGTRRRVHDEDPDAGPPVLAPQACDPAADCRPAPLRAAHPGTSRTSTAHSPAGLQIFRC